MSSLAHLARAGVSLCVLGHVVLLVSGQTCRTLTTFNAALTPRIADYPDRRARQPDALLMEDSDVICLQEYWLEKDIDFMLKAVSSKYRYHYSTLHSSLNVLLTISKKRLIPETACDPADAAYFYFRVLPCVLLRGCVPLFLKSLELGLTCAADKCGLVFKSFSEDCLSCIAVTGTSVATLMEACKPVGSDYNNRFNGPGLVLLSKQEILSAEHHEFFPGKEQTIQRGFIEAEIKDLGTVVCSHFSSAFPYYFEYELSYDNYTQQQREEMAVIQEKFSSRDHIVMADFNTGPRVEGPMDSQTSLAGEAPHNYQLWLQAGYNNTYMEVDGRCTFCTGNTIVDYPRVAIDFVLFKGDYTARQAQRTLDMSPPLSDHYGVRQTVCRN